MEPIKLHYSEALVLRAVRSFMLRFIGWRYVAALAVLLASTFYLFATGERSWFIGVFGSALALGLVLPFAVFIAHWRAALVRLRRLGKAEAIFEPKEDGFRATSDVGTMNLPWSEIKAVWHFPEFWLLFFSQSEFITLPLADANNEVREFILARVRSHGIKVS